MTLPETKLQEFNRAIISGDLGQIKILLSDDKALINRIDKEGLAPLHHACFRSPASVVEYLIQNGADVNLKSNKEDYTALMFAGLSGNLEIVELLLSNGARTNDLNTLKRTAAQMAAFVGHHCVVTLINNYFDKDEVCICAMNHSSSGPNLTNNQISMLYRLMSQLNFTPVKICLALEKDFISMKSSDVSKISSCLIANWRKIVYVAEELCANYFKPHQTHEALSLKFHIFGCLIRQAGGHYDKFISSQSKELNKQPESPLKNMIREFLQGTQPDGLPLGQEQFLRHAITSFPHRESTLWKQIVYQLKDARIGYSPTSLSILIRAINGLLSPIESIGINGVEPCITCGDGVVFGLDKSKLKLCCNCKEVAYCSVDCQRLHWFTHKKFCPILKEKKNKLVKYKTESKPDGDCEMPSETPKECG